MQIQIRLAGLHDAVAIQQLIMSLSDDFFEFADRRGAEPFLASVSLAAISAYLQDARYRYWLAFDQTAGLQGLIALRDNSHVFHLFVAKAKQGTGLASQLWHLVSDYSALHSEKHCMTVNASLNAVPIYQHWGFCATDEVQSMHGIRYLPMVLQRNPTSSAISAQV